MDDAKEPSASMKVRRRIAAPPPTPSFAVKSAMRVLEILEYFDDIQQHATVVDICRALNYPQSSASALLKTMVAAGYLQYNSRNRTYITSGRTALLGSWAGPTLTRGGRLIELMKELNNETGDTVVLATRNGVYAQYIHVVQATNPARLHIALGTARSLASSAAGHVFLSAMSDSEITRLVNRINAEQIVPGLIVKPSDIVLIAAEIRRLGYAFSVDQVTIGGGMIAAPLPHGPDEPQLVIGIGGISQNLVLNRAVLASTLLDKLAAYRASLRDLAA